MLGYHKLYLYNFKNWGKLVSWIFNFLFTILLPNQGVFVVCWDHVWSIFTLRCLWTWATKSKWVIFIWMTSSWSSYFLQPCYQYIRTMSRLCLLCSSNYLEFCNFRISQQSVNFDIDLLPGYWELGDFPNCINWV